METIRMQESIRKPKLPISIAIILYLTFFFYLAFPKAGIKVAEIPITVGDLLFLLLIFFCLTRFNYWLETFNKFRTVIMLLMISSGYALLKLGYSYWHYNLFKAGVFVPIIIYPTIFLILLVLYSQYDIAWKKLLIIPVVAFVILSVYALLQLFLGVETVMVPGLSYNWTDAQNPHILATKYNYYGHFTKIFATYQNGNLFGVNLLLIFPLVFELVYGKSKKFGYIALALFITVAFLTASRAVWAGIVFYVLIRFFLLKKSWGKITVMFPLFLSSSLLLFVEPMRYRANMFLGKDKIPQLIKLPTVEKIIEQAGGGGKAWEQANSYIKPQIENYSERKEPLYKLWDATFGSLNWKAVFFGPHGILLKGTYGITGEMTYAAIFAYLGLIGLVLWSLPILYSLYNFFLGRDDLIMRGILLGLVTYFFVATVEGAYWFSPTAFNIWLIIGIGWTRWHHLQTNECNLV